MVLVALGIVAMLAVVGLILDGGNAFAQQRGSQNGSDSSATAGALVIAQNLPFRAAGQTAPKTDSDVNTAVKSAAQANNVTSYDAYYTDLDGRLIDSSGNVVGSTGAAAKVGGEFLPSAAWGVQVDTSKTFDTTFSRVVGINTMTASTTAVAVAGYVESAGAGNVIPVTIPLNIIYCQNNGKFETQQPPSLWPLNTHLILPLCKGPASGNVGWLDWYPPGGGTSELADAILHPNNPAIPVPSWQYVTETGNINAQQVEDALNHYAGQTVLIPFFDNACDAPNTAENKACPEGSGPGTGQGNYYHMPLFFGFKLDAPKGAFLTGNNGSTCGSMWSGAGCLKGEIVSTIGPNVTVGAGTGTELDAYSAVGVQLIK